MKIKEICGFILAIIVAMARFAGGVISLKSATSPMDTGIGAGLIFVSILILISAVLLWMKRSVFSFRMVVVSLLLFWVDGIVNGFLLFGRPQFTGQIINLCCVVAVIFLLRTVPSRKTGISK